MKLDRVDVNEFKTKAVYLLCLMCERELILDITTIGADPQSIAASQGWHSYETADETCSVACARCIKEAQANEEEREAEASA